MTSEWVPIKIFNFKFIIFVLFFFKFLKLKFLNLRIII